VYGVGFVTRAELEEDFNAIRFMFDSVEEHELHTLFAEAVVAGRRAVHQQEQQRKFATVLDMADLELTTGIPPLDPALKDRITFFDDPRIGNLKIPEYRGAKSGEGAAGSKGSVKEQLLQATNLDQVRQIVIGKLSESGEYSPLPHSADWRLTASFPLAQMDSPRSCR
jgi:hybrid polyketide synthase/nonribosomal peptide synthetase ACE1